MTWLSHRVKDGFSDRDLWSENKILELVITDYNYQIELLFHFNRWENYNSIINKIYLKKNRGLGKFIICL